MRALRYRYGVITVEFALLLPVLLLVVTVGLEVGRIALARVLLERSLYDIAYQMRIAEVKDVEAIGREVLAANSHFLFDPEAVLLSASHADSLAALNAGGNPGGGGSGQLVRLELAAELGVLSRRRGQADAGAEKESGNFRLTMVIANELEF